jgi:TRAP transporter TAXI family solute receptor
MRVKKFVWVLLAMLTIASLSGCSTSAPEAGGSEDANGQTDGKTVISIGTADMGGAYYPIGAAVAQVINDNIPYLEAKVEVTGGALENPKLIYEGQSEIGITNANLAYFALNGEEMYEDKMDNLTQLFSGMSPGVFQIVVKEGSPINSIADLKGKRVAVGPQGGTGLAVIPPILEAYGLTMNDIVPSYISYQDGCDGLVSGNVDASIVMSAMPATAISNVTVNHKLKVIGIDDAIRTKLMRDYSYFVEQDIPKETYDTDSDEKTVAIPNMMLITNELDEQTVYDITKAIFENLEVIHNAHPTGKAIQLENAPKEVIPLHPGAARYYEEKGLM